MCRRCCVLGAFGCVGHRPRLCRTCCLDGQSDSFFLAQKVPRINKKALTANLWPFWCKSFFVAATMETLLFVCLGVFLLSIATLTSCPTPAGRARFIRVSYGPEGPTHRHSPAAPLFGAAQRSAAVRPRVRSGGPGLSPRAVGAGVGSAAGTGRAPGRTAPLRPRSAAAARGSRDAALGAFGLPGPPRCRRLPGLAPLGRGGSACTGRAPAGGRPRAARPRGRAGPGRGRGARRGAEAPPAVGWLRAAPLDSAVPGEGGGAAAAGPRRGEGPGRGRRAAGTAPCRVAPPSPSVRPQPSAPLPQQRELCGCCF